MKKNIFSSIIAQLILLVFVIVWIIPTFGLFISSFRDKDLLAVSGWWTSLTTTQVNEIHRTLNKDSQIQKNDIYANHWFLSFLLAGMRLILEPGPDRIRDFWI